MATTSTSGPPLGDRYVVKEQLGRSPVGVVWKGEDTLLRRAVALRQVAIPSVGADEEQRALRAAVLADARRAAALHHPAAFGVYDVIDGDEIVVVTEVVDWPSLR